MHHIEYDIKQGSDEWRAAKVSKPSASNAKRLITSVGKASESMKGYAGELAEELFSGRSLNEWKGNSATEFGSETEPEGLLAYGMKTDQEVIKCGYIQDEPLYRYLVSPDGLISDNGMVEVKCKPKLHRYTLLYYKKHNKIPTDYIAQLQMQLLISEREWVDIYYYSKYLPCLVERVYPDEKLFKALQNQLALVLEERDRIYNILKEF